MKSPDEELCIYLKSDHFDTFMQEWKKKVKKYGHAGGQILLELNDDNRECIANFLGMNFHKQTMIKIRFNQVIKAIENSRFEGADFNIVLQMYFQDDLLSNKKIRQIEEEKKHQIFINLSEKYKNTKAGEWLEYCLNSKDSIYIQMVKKIHQEPEKFIAECEQVMDAMNNFPMWSHQNMKMSVFAAKITRDPHSFDNHRFMNTLLYHGACYFTSDSYMQKSLLDKNLTFYKVGLLQENINNFCMIAHLLAYDNDKKIHSGWQGFYDRFEIWNVNALNLNSIDSIDRKCCKRVLVIENPSVFQELVHVSKVNIIDQLGFVCTYGNLNYCGYLLLDKIYEAGIEMLYCGDFDPEGLLIADKLKTRYSDRIHLWHYSCEDYYYSHPSKKIDQKRISILEKLTNSQTKDIGNLIKSKGLSGYQENMLDLYKQDIMQWKKEDEYSKS